MTSSPSDQTTQHPGLQSLSWLLTGTSYLRLTAQLLPPTTLLFLVPCTPKGLHASSTTDSNPLPSLPFLRLATTVPSRNGEKQLSQKPCSAPLPAGEARCCFQTTGQLCHKRIGKRSGSGKGTLREKKPREHNRHLLPAATESFQRLFLHPRSSARLQGQQKAHC